MKNKIIALVFCSFFVFFAYGCQDKKADLQKKYDDTTYQIQQTQSKIDELQKELDLYKAAIDDANSTDVTNDTEVGKVLAEQDDEAYHKAIGEMGELQKELETEKLYQDSLKEQIDQN
jgi:chromosome segregation ATPase